MNRALLVLATMLCMSSGVEAQRLQKTDYNDGVIVAYINPATSNTNFNQRKRSDYLIIENISNSPATVNFSYRCIRNNRRDRSVKDETINSSVTIQPGQKWKQFGHLNGGRDAGYCFVDSFSIVNVFGIVDSTSEHDHCHDRGHGHGRDHGHDWDRNHDRNYEHGHGRDRNHGHGNNPTSQNGVIPSWFLGDWVMNNGNSGRSRAHSENKTLEWFDKNIADCVMVDGDNIFFRWRHDNTEARIMRISSYQVLYHNPGTGAAYVLVRK